MLQENFFLITTETLRKAVREKRQQLFEKAKAENKRPDPYNIDQLDRIRGEIDDYPNRKHFAINLYAVKWLGLKEEDLEFIMALKI